jgi:hypothetical protein
MRSARTPDRVEGINEHSRRVPPLSIRIEAVGIQQTIAFSSEVETGSHEENASEQDPKPGSDSIRTDQALGVQHRVICIALFPERSRARSIRPSSTLLPSRRYMPPLRKVNNSIERCRR